MDTNTRKPMSKQRSEWREFTTDPIGGIEVRAFVRNVNDGRLVALVALEPSGWHMSISHTGHQERMIRYPKWDEIADARDLMLDPGLDFVMWLPKAEDYVALHDSTFHLHQHPPLEVPS